MKYLLTILLGLACSPAWAQISIDKKHRVSNLPPGYCSWCSIEMLGRHHGIKPLFDLVKLRQKDSDAWVQVNGEWRVYKKNRGYDFTIRMKLDELGVAYRMSGVGRFDRSLIEYAMKNKLGCAVAAKTGAFGNTPHAFVLTHYDSKIVKFIDPNYAEWNYEATRGWFDTWWDGWVLVLLPGVQEDVKTADQ